MKKQLAGVLGFALILVSGSCDNNDKSDTETIVDGTIEKIFYSTPEKLLEEFSSAVNSSNYEVLENMIQDPNIIFNLINRIEKYGWTINTYSIKDIDKNTVSVSFAQDTKQIIDDGYFIQELELKQINDNDVSKTSWVIDNEIWRLFIYRILFSSNRTGEHNLYVIDPTGFNEERLTTNGGLFPHCRADGELIVYQRNGKIYTMNPDGTNHKYITQGTEPEWSWDGKRIAYSYNGGIYIYTLEEGTNIYVPSPSKSHSPSWSPDDQKLVFVSYHNGLEGEVYTVNTDGDSLRRISSDGSYPSCSIENNIVYNVNNGLEVTDSNGNNSSYLFLPRAMQPAWSPDGRRIAFIRYPDMSNLTLEDFASVSSPDELNIGKINIFISDANGNNVIQLTEEGGVQPAWLLSEQTEPKLYGRADYPETSYLTIWSGPLNLRDAPNIDSEVVDKLRTGQRVWFVDEGPMDYRANHNAPWIKVVTQGGIEGYIFSYFSDY